MHPSTDDIGVHLHLDHPHFPHCKQRRPIRLVGEFTLRPGSVGGTAETRFPLRHRSHGFARPVSPPDPRLFARVASGPATFADGLTTFAAAQVSPVDRLSRLDCHEERPRRSHWIPQAARAGVHRAGTATADPAAKGRSLLRSGPVSSALLPKTQRRGIRTDRRRGKTGQRPGKSRRRLGRRRAKGPPRQQNRFATDVNLWQISGKSASTGSAVAVESPRTRLPATCFRGAASGI